MGLYGWTGKILRVDLSAGEVSTMDTRKCVPEFVGGLGLAVRIAWEELMPEVSPFDAENMLFVMVGRRRAPWPPAGGGRWWRASPRSSIRRRSLARV